ncbi:pilus assembly protein TadG-related protein [Eubacteriaceae bacterium ES3]|nr:pilus assembly protein TadG-related protein [Eubacteriaceae bacterium ES3]
MRGLKVLKKILTDESGDTLIIIAASMVFIMGFLALVIDLGLVYLIAGQQQTAADAAALAAAHDLPNSSTAITTAKNYAELNGTEEINTTVTTPYYGDSQMIEVVCTKNVEYSFAKIFGFDNIDVSGRAVAKITYHWEGDALPFINLDDDYTADPEIVAWEDVSPGDKESILEGEDYGMYQLVNGDDPETCYFKVDYQNGVVLKEGTVAVIKQEIGYVYEQHLGGFVYVLSLKPDVINSGSVLLTDGTYRSLENLKNEDMIDPSQIVLLKCIFHDYDYKGKNLYLTYIEDYDIYNGELPSDYVNPEGGSSSLVE